MDIQKGTYTYTGSGGQKRHIPIERVYSFSQLRKGDHIATRRCDGLYFHHAIVEVVLEGIIIVIEYSNYAEEILLDVFDLRSPGKAKVMRRNYIWEDGLYLIKHPDHTCLPAATVIARAQSRLGESRYNLFYQNSEHFVMWCKTGISSSEQVKNIEETVKKAAKENGPPLVVVGGSISQKEYDFVGKRIVSGVSSVTGAIAGAAVGQVLIPVPVVGGIVGSVIGGMVGRLCGNSAWNA